MYNSKNRNEFLGIDIGSSAIKAIKLKVVDSGIQLTDHGCVTFPTPAIKDGKIIDRKSIVDALKSIKFLFSAEKQPENVCVSIPGVSTTTRFARLPEFSYREFNKLLNSEAQTYCDPEKYTFSAKLLNEKEPDFSEANPVTKKCVMLLMAEKSMLGEYAETLQESGISCANFSVDILASVKAFESACKKHAEGEENTGIIHVGAQTTNISVVKSGILIFTRSMQNDEEKISPEKISFEARRSFDYFLEQSRESKISRIILSGGPSSDEVFRQSIGKNLGIAIELGNPLEEIEITASDKAGIISNIYQFPVAIGLALISVHAATITRLNSGFF
ncbi:MAG: pilus assembly protein PilM [Candidatus Riflebacteria bacterium]|nr:pilus assembly protein PilM [Candidatus Riflebacteria bacterium]